MKKHEKAILSAANRAFDIGNEKADDILNSIEAVHGKTARDAVQAVYAMAAMQVCASEAFVNTTTLPKKAVDSVRHGLGVALDNLARTTLHLAVGYVVPKCDASGCECDPRATELKRMLGVLIQMHLGEQAILQREVNEILKK
jgi:hypothetical protein